MSPPGTACLTGSRPNGAAKLAYFTYRNNRNKKKAIF